jgi:hypothetical protein
MTLQACRLGIEAAVDFIKTPIDFVKTLVHALAETLNPAFKALLEVDDEFLQTAHITIV